MRARGWDSKGMKGTGKEREIVGGSEGETDGEGGEGDRQRVREGREE